MSCGLWNTRGFVNNDHSRLREGVILATKLDLICLYETFLRNSENISIPGYKWFGNNRAHISKRANRGSGGVGILVKDSMFQKFSITCVDRQHEDILWVSFTNIDNPDHVFYVCVCYLPPAASSRGDKSHEFFDILRTQMLRYQDVGEIIICGDLNARIGNLNQSPEEDTVLPSRQIIDKVINSHGKQLVDFLKDCGMITLNGRFLNEEDNFTVLSPLGKSVVDYVLVQSDCFIQFREFRVRPVLDLIDYYSIPTDSSMPDHSLLTWQYCNGNTPAEKMTSNTITRDQTQRAFRCKPGKPVLKPNGDLDKALDILIRELDEYTTHNYSPTAETGLEDNYGKFYAVIEKAFKNHNTHHRSSRKPWWNAELDSLRKDLRQAQKEWSKSSHQPDKTVLWQRYKQKQRVFSLCIRKEKRNYLRQKQEKMLYLKVSSTSKFWEAFNKISIADDRTIRKNLPENMLKPDSSLALNAAESIEVWVNHFKTILNPSQTGQGLGELSREGNPATSNSNYIGHEILSNPITFEEVEEAINSLNENKSPGQDRICPSVLKDNKIIQYLVRIYQCCFTNEIVPKSWQTSVIQPIYKGSGHINNPDAYRGITIQSCITKAFCKVLNNRLRNYLELNGIIRDEQNGFRKNRSCQDHISSLHSILENRKLNKLDTYTCFVDFKKAFDSVSRELLWHKLSVNGINDKFLACLQALYTGVTSSVRINNDLSPSFPINCGVKQGCPLSPTLFNIFINDLIEYLNEGCEGITFGDCKLNALLYADDLILIAENPHKLQSLLQSLSHWCLNNGMTINPEKTKIMHFRTPRKTICNHKFLCCGMTIEYTASYKYLGIIFTEHLDWTKTIENASVSAGRSANYIVAKARSSGTFAYGVFTHLYSALVLPIIEYSSFLWGSKSYAQINKIQNNLMRSFLGVGRNAPISALLGDMGWLPIPTLTKISCIRFFLRLSKMTPNRLNYKIFKEACKLAENGRKNWVHSTRSILKDTSTNYQPTLDCSHSLNQYKAVVISMYDTEWRSSLNYINPQSESGGRLSIYRTIKNTPNTESYVINTRSVGGRRVLAGLRMGCLPLAVETGRYCNTPYQDRVCRLCDRGEVEDQPHFLCICPAFQNLRHHLFNHCNSLSSNFYQLSLEEKVKFILCNYDTQIVNLLTTLYSHRQSLLFK